MIKRSLFSPTYFLGCGFMKYLNTYTILTKLDWKKDRLLTSEHMYLNND